MMERASKFGIAALMCLAFGVASCGDSTAPEEDAGPITLKIVGGDEQSGIVGQELRDPLVVKATNHRGRPLRRYLVNFVVTQGDGSVYAGAAMTNWRGVAQDYWTLGSEPGVNVVEVRAVNSWTGEKQVFATFEATGVPVPVHTVEVTPESVVEVRAVNSWTGEKQVFATFEATGVPVPVHTVEVTPESAELQLIVSPTVQLDVVLKDGDDNVLTGREVDWTSSDEGVATVDENGLVTAVGEGDATITATSGGESDDAAITVQRAPVHTVAVEPTDFALVVGGEPSAQQLTVTLLDAAGNELTGRDVDFSVDPTGVVTVTDDGLVTAMAEGGATITVTSEGVETEATVSVTAAPGSAGDVYEPNNSSATAADLGTIIEGRTLSIQANFHDPGADQDDWYWIEAQQGTLNQCNPVSGMEDFRLRVSLTGIPVGSDYDLYLYAENNANSPLEESIRGSNLPEAVSRDLAGDCAASDRFGFWVRVQHYEGPATTDLYTLSMTFERP
jgi:uncharacterized protein YjdB